jgi:hypothetical protein
VKTVAFVGNFDVSYSTESHHAATYENYLGWRVIRFQQNRIEEDEIIDVLENQSIQLFAATHTHGWPCFSMRTVNNLRELNIPSYSYHLDKYFGIGSRQNEYLDHPSFHLDYFFSTDGGNEEGWKAKNINHRWLLPGVYEGETNYGRASDSRVPVLFTGSTGYHGEYPFRPKLVSALHSNYGENFKVVTGVRGQDLNDLYANATVIVGDHIFAGCPRYCSDRLFEVIGRGGFIIYPETQDVTEHIPGLVTYKPQDTQDLTHKIDYYLDKGHESERIERRNMAHEWCKKHGTYTVRLREILRIMGLE